MLIAVVRSLAHIRANILEACKRSMESSRGGSVDDVEYHYGIACDRCDLKIAPFISLNGLAPIVQCLAVVPVLLLGGAFEGANRVGPSCITGRAHDRRFNAMIATGLAP